MEFLIKEAASNDWITATKGGDLVKLSPAMGKGFDTDCQVPCLLQVELLSISDAKKH